MEGELWGKRGLFLLKLLKGLGPVQFLLGQYRRPKIGHLHWRQLCLVLTYCTIKTPIHDSIYQVRPFVLSFPNRLVNVTSQPAPRGSKQEIHAISL